MSLNSVFSKNGLIKKLYFKFITQLLTRTLIRYRELNYDYEIEYSKIELSKKYQTYFFYISSVRNAMVSLATYLKLRLILRCAV